ncbi:NLR family CARD domain-containing protein 3-like isoform X2 [Clupea harengus]|nr:NLR family CARD domain-containing protein 3-like isoform X2 [Clupea harengus]
MSFPPGEGHLETTPPLAECTGSDSKVGPGQRPGSPVPSCVSMKSDRSMDTPLRFKDHAPTSGPDQRPGSPVPSCVSMKSDRSMDTPLRFKDHASTSGPDQRPGSPVPSCVSMKSDRSMDTPLRFKDHASTSGPDQRPGSPVPSCVSMKSDRSMDTPLRFKDHASTSCLSMKSDFSMEKPPNMSERRSLDEQSCLSIKSDFSMEKPPNLRERRSLDEQSFHSGVDSHTPDHDRTMTSPGTSHHDSEEDVLVKARSYEETFQMKLKSVQRTKLQHVLEDPSNPVLLSEIYTELYITEGDAGEINDEHEIREIEAASRGNLVADDTPIKCSEIFKPLPGRQCQSIRTVLTKGIAGIGKTVCVQKFVLDWAEETANQDIRYVFPLSFRELNLLKTERLSLAELLRHFVGDFKEQVLDQSRQLLIFDGLDECRLPLDFEKNEKLCKPAMAASVDVLLTNLIQGNLFPSALIWITSRPAAAGRIPPGCVDRVTAVRGFGDPQKDEYFRKRIGNPDLAEKVITHVLSLRSLHIMCHIPVFCWISATVLQRLLEEADDCAVPKNLTQMYTHFLIIQTDVVKAKKYTEATDTSHKMIFKLGKLAFQQLEKGNLIFYEEDLRECGIDVTEASVYSGVCTQIFREESGLYQGRVFCFVHLSIQEFLAALYVLVNFHSEGSEPPQSSSLAGLLTAPTLSDLQQTAVDKALQQPNGNLDLFLRFLLGLCSSPPQSDQTLLQSFLPHVRITSTSATGVVDYIKTRIMINPSPEQSINLFHCLNELDDHSLVEQIQAYVSSRRLSKVTLTPELRSALVFVLLMSKSSLDVFDLGKYCARPSDKSLFQMRPVLRECRRAELASCNLTEMSCETLATVICSQTSHLRELDLSDNDLQDLGVASLCQGLEKPSCKLEKLCLSKCGIRARGCESLMMALIQNPTHLTELDLSHNEPGPEGMTLLSEVLRDPQCRVDKLKLINCNLKDRSCKPLAMALGSKTSSLRLLDLSNNFIADSGVIQLSHGLRNINCKLTSLRLSKCGVRGEGCHALASALGSNPYHLRELFISYNKIGFLGAQQLEAVKWNSQSKLEKLML